MALTFNNRTALITGAGRGIGKAIALKLASLGTKVICVSKSSSCEAVAESIRSNGGQAEALSVDVSDGEAVAEACERLLSEHECIDILVNNAGITRDGLLLRMSDEDWDSVISTNLSSCFYWTRGLLRPMTKKRWGRILFISSVVGIMGNPGQFNYCAAKGGMIAAAKSLAKEVSSRNITVNVIAPGFIQTDMTASLDEKTADLIKKMIPLNRMGNPEDIANTAVYFVSEEANYVTGQVFSVDGGMAM